jgi:hypothetical protein
VSGADNGHASVLIGQITEGLYPHFGVGGIVLGDELDFGSPNPSLPVDLFYGEGSPFQQESARGFGRAAQGGKEADSDLLSPGLSQNREGKEQEEG